MTATPTETIRSPLAKSYTPQECEGEIRAKWEASGAFHADPTRPQQAFCILIPPPNVTAALHLGHAFNNTLQDILVRYHRMRGYKALWMPGTDHAGIATQTVVEKRLIAQGKRRTDFSREQFVEMVQAWKDEYEATITEQLRAMGCSCDWARQRFTMDDICANAVREAFFELFKAGLIYRGKRLVNWDPVTLTALADDEVDMKEVAGHMWYLRYPLEDGSGCVTVATTRPETMLGDTAVAVNPDDPQRKPYIGKKVRLPIVDRVIEIIGDDYVVIPDPASSDAKAQYASGFLKVTPAHDPNDWEIGRRHELDVINVMGPDGSISDKHGWGDCSEEAKQFVGMSREDARSAIVEWFKGEGLLEKVRDYSHSVGHSYRSHVPIEPYLSDQWYVKVSDDRLVGEAQRALADEQFEGEKPARPDLSGTGHWPVQAEQSEAKQGVSPVKVGAELTSYERNLPHWQIGGSVYYITFRVRDARAPLSAEERRIVLDACTHWHGRRTHVFVVTVLPDHVHLIMQPLKKEVDRTGQRPVPPGKQSEPEWYSLSDLMHGIKGTSAREINRHREDTGSIWQDESYDRIIRNEREFLEKWNYVIENPVRAGLVTDIEEYEFTCVVDRHEYPDDSNRPVACSTREGDGDLKFYPPRYSKMYEMWHANLRDWCISRQLWWGHRIPVWWKHMPVCEVSGDLQQQLTVWENEGKICVSHPGGEQSSGPDDARNTPVLNAICVAPTSETSTIEKYLSDHGWSQDPDVLDTWFSSGLWPISTMGWPDPDAYPVEIPEGGALLDAFNPSSVLCTGRDIITLWVSRMVMFNRFFRDGRLPFKDVYIHPMIQDGHGQRMSKSLGNGVDPRDIIHTHGADAMRFTLAQMATTTQDSRLPVDTLCPHCETAFPPEEITSPAGYRVAAPTQTCPKCRKRMMTLYGALAGVNEADDDPPQARNSSRKFDLGRNFCNKLWNATRFALGNIESSDDSGASIVGTLRLADLALADRWIITRLHRTLHRIEDAIAEYQFNAYAEAMYDFIWREFCDWYLEAIKPTVRDDAAQQHVLRTVLNATLRLLHPICPFVSESLWPHVRAAGPAGLEGIVLADDDLLAAAAWPDIACAVDDEQADALFGRAQALVETIRTVRGERKVPDRRSVRLMATAEVAALIDSTDQIIGTMAGLSDVQPMGDRPADAAVVLFEGQELYLFDLLDAADVDAERARLQKELASLDKQIGNFNGRLSNEKYVSKAPAEMVQETRDNLAEAQRARHAAADALDALEGSS